MPAAAWHWAAGNAQPRLHAVFAGGPSSEGLRAQAKLLKLLEIYMEDRLALSSAGKADDIEPERFGTARVRVRAHVHAYV